MNMHIDISAMSVNNNNYYYDDNDDDDYYYKYWRKRPLLRPKM